MVVPRLFTKQVDVLEAAAEDCRERGIGTALECQLDSLWHSLRLLHRLTEVEKFQLREHIIPPTYAHDLTAGCGTFNPYAVADWAATLVRGSTRPWGIVSNLTEYAGHTVQVCFDRRGAARPACHLRRGPC